ncbi:MAG TPA: DUF2851 family protein [Chloroflexota bacterium]|nr:DUF2851 family protein [Chloroflexota bacterium]
MRKRVEQPAVPAEEALVEAWRRTAGAGPLRTEDGTALEVRYPGRRNGAAGPDFLDAILSTAAGEVRGAVEVHRRSSDWERHGHGTDARYAGVVLHVVGQHDGGAGQLPGGGAPPLLVLGLGQPGGAAGMLPAFPCHGAGRALLPHLQGAGDRRLDLAVRRLEAALRQAPAVAPAATGGGRRTGGAWEQVAYEALAEALGYAPNGEPMRELAAAVPLREVRRLRAPAQAEALLLGSAGLLPMQRHLPAARRRDGYVAALERAWEAWGRRPALRAYRWETGRVRPENAPVRRVVALARLALAWPPAGLVPRLLDVVRGAGPPAAVNRRLASLVALPRPVGYWATHWDFGVLAARPALGSPPGAQDGAGTALIGPSRAADAVVNVLLPLAIAVGQLQDDDTLCRRAQAAYRVHPPLAENWITRLMRERTGLATGHGDLIRTAAIQQGLLAIYEGPCRDLRCECCPLNPASPHPSPPPRAG